MSHKESPNAVPQAPAPQRRLDEAEVKMRQLSRRSFLWAGIAVAGTLMGRRWLTTRRQEGGIPWPFRRAMDFNQDLTQDYFDPNRLEPTFDPVLAEAPRPNGDYGVDTALDPDTWILRVQGLHDMSKATTNYQLPGYDEADSTDSDSSRDSPNDSSASTDRKKTPSDAKGARIPEGHSQDSSGGDAAPGDGYPPAVILRMADIMKLPAYEMTTLFKCVEGWSNIVTWKGARFSDFIERYAPITQSGDVPDVKNRPGDLVPWIALETPDGNYYVAIDIQTALHSQTLLAYEMNGKPLAQEHGAPLRLFTPLKYGIKNLKRIGLIKFTLERPADYWGEQGYDYYAGH